MATKKEAIVALEVLSLIMDEYCGPIPDQEMDDAKFAFRVMCEFVDQASMEDDPDYNPHPDWPVEPLCCSFHYPSVAGA